MSTYAMDQMHTGDAALVLHEAFYFDVLSKFTIRHYNPRFTKAIMCAKKDHLMVVATNSPELTHIVPTLGCSLEVWGAMSSLMNAVLHSMDMEADDDTQMELLNKLERRLKYAQQVIKVEELYDHDLRPMDEVQQTRDIAELYRLAGLIYLYRIGYHATVSNPSLQAVTKSAFEILEKLHTCERTFPLFIVGCEARTDEQRATVLRLLNSTRAHFTPKQIMRAHEYLERFWAASELDVALETTYEEKMTAVLSFRGVMAAFL